jgi:hypothetical protein
MRILVPFGLLVPLTEGLRRSTFASRQFSAGYDLIRLGRFPVRLGSL